VTSALVKGPKAGLLEKQVRDRYGQIASGGGCCTSASGEISCCSGSDASLELGYTSEELAGLPAGANLGLGCGNPTALLSLTSGEVVLDLGSGAGIDCFLAAKKVGPRGRVIGVDMTPEMLARARANAQSGGYRNVEFRLGEIEHLPVADASVDVIVSNCVINLASDKGAVYREAFRVLRAGGRLAVSDVVATRPFTKRERSDPALWSSCSSGAISVTTMKNLLRRAGFKKIGIEVDEAKTPPKTLTEQRSLGVIPARILAVKSPERRSPQARTAPHRSRRNAR